MIGFFAGFEQADEDSFFRKEEMASKEEIRKNSLARLIQNLGTMDWEWLKEGDDLELVELFGKLLEQKQFPVRALGILGLVRWGSPRAIQKIAELSYIKRRYWASLLDLDALPTQSEPRSDDPRDIRPFLKRSFQNGSVFWGHLFQLAGEKNPHSIENFVGEGYSQHKGVRFLIHRHLTLLAYPEVVCMNCRCHTRMKVYKKGSDRVYCPKCYKEDALEFPITKIIGFIGAPTTPKEEKQVIFSLWDKKARSAQAAEIDQLQIGYEKKLDYDWAISAVFNKMQDYYPERLGKVVIHIAPEVKPLLEDNTIRILEKLELG